MKLLVGLGNPGSEYARTRHNLGFLLTELLARQSAGLDPLALVGTGPAVAALFQPAKTFSVAVPGARPAALSGFSWRRLADPDLLLVRPERYMNRSGEPLAQLIHRLGWLPESSAGELSAVDLSAVDLSAVDLSAVDLSAVDLDAAPAAAARAAPSPAPASLPLLVAYDELDLPFASLRLRASGGHGGHNGMRSILSSLGTDRFPRLRIGIGRGGTDAARHVLEEFTPAEWTEVLTSLQEAAEAVLAWAGGLEFDKCMTRFHSRWTQGR
jgi:peptidyl-tRNA hydrolase, PTH1 family